MKRLMLVVVLALPMILAADKAEKATELTVRGAFGWIPKEHRFTVDHEGNIVWKTADQDAATKAVHDSKRGTRILIKKLPLEYHRRQGDEAVLSGRKEMEMGKSLFVLHVKLYTDMGVRDRMKNDKMVADVEADIFSVEYERSGKSASCSIILENETVR